MTFVGGEVPSRWEHYRSVNEALIVDAEARCLIPFKAPLNRAQFIDSVTSLKKRSRNVLLDDVLEDIEGNVVSLTAIDYFWFDDSLKENLAGITSSRGASVSPLSAVINLCLTTRYYDTDVLRAQGVSVFHAPAAGGGTLPEFRELLFMTRLIDSVGMCFDGAIGVHCTHGLNRTCFFLAAYAAIKQDKPVSDSLLLVQRARGHTMYRHDLCDSLEEQEKSGLLAEVRRLTTYEQSRRTFVIGPVGDDVIIENVHIALVRGLNETRSVNVAAVRRRTWKETACVEVSLVGDVDATLRVPQTCGLKNATVLWCDVSNTV